MAEKEGIDNNDSKESEFISIEEVDLDDQIEIISPEKDTVEPLEVVPEAVANEESEPFFPFHLFLFFPIIFKIRKLPIWQLN